MTRPARFSISLLLCFALVLLGCGGSGDDSSNSEATPTSAVTGANSSAPVDEEYCRVARRTQDVARSEYGSVVEDQLAVAPEELRGALETLSDNVDVLIDPSASPDRLDVIRQPLLDVIAYQIRSCGMTVSLFGG